MFRRAPSSRSSRATRRLAVALVCGLAALSQAHAVPLPDVSAVIGNQVPLDGFVDENGKAFLSDDNPDGVPWVISPIYARCLGTCSPITAGLRRALRQSGLTPSEYRVVSFTFDAQESGSDLHAFRDRMSLPPQWITLRAVDAEVLARTLASLDFRTMALDNGQYDHPNLIAILTPDRHLAAFMFGVEFAPQSLATTLRDARVARLTGREERLPLAFVAVLGLLLTSFVFAALLVRRHVDS